VSFTDFCKSYGAGMMANTHSVETDGGVASVPASSTPGSNHHIISDEMYEPEELETSLEGIKLIQTVTDSYTTRCPWCSMVITKSNM